VDNTRLLVSCAEMVREGGLGEDISELPAAGACLESVSEKALAIGQYFVASGLLVVFGEELLPISGSENVSEYMFSGIAEDLGGRWAVESDPIKAADLILAHIERKRDALGINQAKERKLYDMADRRALTVD
jgi:carbon-monoxide dehydrogenase catalytic subunit